MPNKFKLTANQIHHLSHARKEIRTAQEECADDASGFYSKCDELMYSIDELIDEEEGTL